MSLKAQLLQLVLPLLLLLLLLQISTAACV